MIRNIIVTGAAGNLGSAVVEKFKREGYQVIALIQPGVGTPVEEADYNYEVDVTDEQAVDEFVKEYQVQYQDLDAMALLVGGFSMGRIEDTTRGELEKMFNLNFFSAFHLVKGFLPFLKKQNKGAFLFVGARPAIHLEQAQETFSYGMSKSLLMSLAEFVANLTQETAIRSHVFVPSIIDTPVNRESMPEEDFSKWVSPREIAEAMHYAINNRALRNMTFTLYGDV